MTLSPAGAALTLPMAAMVLIRFHLQILVPKYLSQLMKQVQVPHNI